MWLLISLLLGHKLTWSILALKRVLLNAVALAKFIKIHIARILVDTRYVNFVACIHLPTIQHSFPKIGLEFPIEFLNTNHQTYKSDWKPNIHSWITHISKKTWFSQSGRLSRFVHIQSMISVSSWGKSVTKSLPPSDHQKQCWIQTSNYFFKTKEIYRWRYKE